MTHAHTLATEVDIWLSPAPYGVIEDANGLVIRDANGLPICVFYTVGESDIDDRAAHDAHAYAQLVPLLKAAIDVLAELDSCFQAGTDGAAFGNLQRKREALRTQILAALGKLPMEAP